MSRVPLASITVTMTESPLAHVWHGRPMATWGVADLVVRQMGHAAPELGAHKTWLAVRWTDGEELRGRLDVTRAHAAPEAPFDPLVRHVRAKLIYAAGRGRPPAIPPAAWEGIHADQGPELEARAERLLDGYELPEPMGHLPLPVRPRYPELAGLDVRDGRIVTPGRFEGLHEWGPVLWARAFNGMAGEGEGGAFTFSNFDELSLDFPALVAVGTVRLWQREDGIVVVEPRERR